MTRTASFFLLLHILLTDAVFAQSSGVEPVEVVEIGAGNAEINLTRFLREYKDASGELTITDVVVLPREQFAPIPAALDSLQLENPNEVRWLLLQINNTATEPVPVTLESSSALLRYLTVYLPDEEGWSAQHTGNNLPFGERATASFWLTLNWLVSPGHHDYYLRVQAAIEQPVALQLYTGNAYVDAEMSDQLTGGILMGIGVGIALFHLFIYFQTRDWVYLAFVASIVFGLAYRAYFEGVGQAVTQNWLYWNEVAFYVCLGFYVASVLWFHTTFLKLKQVSPRQHVFNQIWALAYVFLVTVALALGFNIGVTFEASLVVLPVYLLGSSLKRAMQGYRPARFYFFALAFPLVMGLMSAFLSLNNIMHSESFMWIERFSIATAMMFFAFGLADRINILNAEKQSAEQIANAAKLETQMKSDFLAKMSHEIRTPMNGVIGMSQLLAGSGLNSEQTHFNDMIHSSGKTLLKVINDLLDFSKAEAGKLEVEAIPFNLAELVDEMECMFSTQSQESGIVLNCEIAADVPTELRGDPIRVRQILINLIGNAFKFTKAGEINVSVSNGGKGNIRFSVADSGIGIDETHLKQLFQPFSQASTATTREYGGTGLGLTICKQLTEIMGGSIWVESNGKVARTTSQQVSVSDEGEQRIGSRFSFELPLLSAGSAEANTKPDAASNIQTTIAEAGVEDRPDQALKILVAEDNPVNQMVIRGMLSKMGHEVTIAQHGGEALELAKAQYQDWDMVLMDCEMPVMDGYQTARSIRDFERDSVNSQLPILALTAHAIDGSRARCLESGMNAHITKPVQFDELHQAILTYRASEKLVQSAGLASYKAQFSNYP